MLITNSNLHIKAPRACLPRLIGLRVVPCLAVPTAVWNSLDITGHRWPYMPREEPEWRRKVEETRVKNGHLEAADRLMFCRLLQSARISTSETAYYFGSTLPKPPKIKPLPLDPPYAAQGLEALTTEVVK